MREMVRILNQEDRAKIAKTAELASDPSLKHLRRCYAVVRYLDETKQIPSTGAQREAIELAAWLSRNLTCDRQVPTPTHVLKAIRDVED